MCQFSIEGKEKFLYRVERIVFFSALTVMKKLEETFLWGIRMSRNLNADIALFLAFLSFFIFYFCYRRPVHVFNFKRFWKQAKSFWRMTNICERWNKSWKKRIRKVWMSMGLIRVQWKFCWLNSLWSFNLATVAQGCSLGNYKLNINGKLKCELRNLEWHK